MKTMLLVLVMLLVAVAITVAWAKAYPARSYNSTIITLCDRSTAAHFKVGEVLSDDVGQLMKVVAINHQTGELTVCAVQPKDRGPYR